MKYVYEMSFEEIKNLMDAFLASGLFYSDKIEFAQKFLNGEVTSKTIEELMY